VSDSPKKAHDSEPAGAESGARRTEWVTAAITTLVVLALLAAAFMKFVQPGNSDGPAE